MLRAAQAHGVQVVVINARMSPRSLRRYQRLGFLARPLFSGIHLCAAQTEEYAAAFRELGVLADRVHVTGSVKFDGVTADRHNPRTEELRRFLDVRPTDLVWIAGSTQAPEEQITLDLFRRLQTEHANLRFFLVPRQKDRFEEVAALLRRSGLPFVRRSTLTAPVADPGALIPPDTLGEPRAPRGPAAVGVAGGGPAGARGGAHTHG